MTTQTAVAPTRAAGVPDLADLDIDTLLELYPSRMEPMPESGYQFPFVHALGEVLLRWLPEAFPGSVIFGDNFIYYLDRDGQRRAISPDLAISFDAEAALGDYWISYFVELVGKPPDFVMEIGSRSTYYRDMNVKRDAYAWMGVSEYWMFDPMGGRHYPFALRGMRLVEGEYRPLEMIESPDGSVRGHSEVLGLDLFWDGSDLHLIDSATGERLRRSGEIAAGERAAQRRLQEAEARAAEIHARAEEARARAEEEARAHAEERRAREAAEARAEEAEAELARLRRLMESPPS